MMMQGTKSLKTFVFLRLEDMAWNKNLEIRFILNATSKTACFLCFKKAFHEGWISKLNSTRNLIHSECYFKNSVFFMLQKNISWRLNFETQFEDFELPYLLHSKNAWMNPWETNRLTKEKKTKAKQTKNNLEISNYESVSCLFRNWGYYWHPRNLKTRSFPSSNCQVFLDRKLNR